MTEQRPLLSICIATRDRAGWLARSLPRVLEETRPYQDLVEVRVFDASSSDAALEVARGLGDHGNLYFHREESGAGRGRFVWNLQDDALVLPGCVDRLLGALTRHPEVEVLFLNQAYADYSRPEELAEPEPVLLASEPASREFRDVYAPEGLAPAAAGVVYRAGNGATTARRPACWIGDPSVVVRRDVVKADS